MATNLEKLFKGSSSTFTKNHLITCMAHVLNLVVQCGLKELGNDEPYLDIEGLEAIS